MSSADPQDESVVAGRLIERLLVDPVFRAEFRRDPVGACVAAGLPELAAELGGGVGSGMETLELRESRSTLAGVVMAAAVEGLSVAEAQAFVEHGAKGLRLGHGLKLPRGVRAPAGVSKVQGLEHRVVGRVHHAEGQVQHQVKAAERAGGGSSSPASSPGSQSSGAAGSSSASHTGGGSAAGGHAASSAPQASAPPATPAQAAASAQSAPGSPAAGGTPAGGSTHAAATHAAGGSPVASAASSSPAPASASTPVSSGSSSSLPWPDAPGAGNGGGSGAVSGAVDAAASAPAAGSFSMAGVLDSPSLQASPQARAFLASGGADPRVVSMLGSALSHHQLGIASVVSTSSPVHVQSLDIVSVDGQPVGPDNFAARDLVTEIAAMNPGARPDEVGTPWPIQSPGFFSDQSSQASLHLAFEMPGTNAGVAEQAAAVPGAAVPGAAVPGAAVPGAAGAPIPGAASYPAPAYAAASYPAAAAPGTVQPAVAGAVPATGVPGTGVPATSGAPGSSAAEQAQQLAGSGAPVSLAGGSDGERQDLVDGPLCRLGGRQAVRLWRRPRGLQRAARL